MRKKAGFIVLSMALAGSLMGCSLPFNKKSDKETKPTVTEEIQAATESTETTKEVSSENADTETTEGAASTTQPEESNELPEEKEVGFGISEMPEEYTDDMVVDSELSCKVQTDDGEAVYHLPYIDYDSTACENVNAQVEKIGDEYMAKQDGYSTDCVAIGYEWTIYKDMLSVVMKLDFELNEYAYFYVVYTIDLRRDVLLSKNDVLDYLEIDKTLYEKNVQNTLDSGFTSKYKDLEMEIDSYLKGLYDQTVSLSNVHEAVPYVDKDSTLCVIGNIYSYAGPDYYSYQLSVDTLDDKCAYSGEVYEVPHYNPSSDDFSDDYIFSYSNREYLTEDDLDGLTPDEIRLAYNELYARYGIKFKDADYQSYFNSKSWYQGTIDSDKFNDTGMFNKYELANRDFIIAYEKEKGYK